MVSGAPEPKRGVALPPEAPTFRGHMPIALPAIAQRLHHGDDPEAAVRAQLHSRNRFAIIVLATALVGIPASLALRSIAKRRSAVPAHVIAAEESVLGLLRRDDRRSRKQAIQDVAHLVEANPSTKSARGLQVLALTLELDDVKLNVKRIQAQSDDINSRIARMRERRNPSDWEAQVNRGIAQIQALKIQSDPLVEQATSLDKQVSGAFTELLASREELPPAEQLAATRAEAVYFGVKGSDKALQLAERYRQLGGKDGWDAIAFGEYAANARVAPETLSQARTALEMLRTADSAFMRAYVLAARLALAQRDHDAASLLIEAALALNPSHDLAPELVRWIEESRQSDPRPAEVRGPPK